MTNPAQAAQWNFRHADSKMVLCTTSVLLLSQSWEKEVSGTKKSIGRAVIEIAFIIFLFYSNLLMGEFERSGQGRLRGFVWAMGDVFTSANFGIAVAAAVVGYVVFEFLRTRF